MSWIEKLHQTYENCSSQIGDPTDKNPLLPIFHTTQQAQIEVILNGNGEFQEARITSKNERETIIPYDESQGRTGSKPQNYPLADKLQYLAGDFEKAGGEVTSGFSKEPKAPYQKFLKELAKWSKSSQNNPTLAAILKYLEKGCLMEDLIQQGILPTDPNTGRVLREPIKDSGELPEIFKSIPTGNSPDTAFVRWVVEIPGELQSKTWTNPALWKSWIDYYSQIQGNLGFCHVTGEIQSLAGNHPAKIRNTGDSAKLISANDTSGFVYRGLFTDDAGLQACGVSAQVTQKAHNALRWLISRRGRNDGDQALVAWSSSGKKIPTIYEDTSSLFDDEPEELSIPTQTQVSQAFALKLTRKVKGFREELGASDEIMILVLESATKGRLAITYYRELKASEFLDKLESWHRDCAWHQRFGKDRLFVGAPSPKDIATTAYGARVGDKLLTATYRRLLPCIIDSQKIPQDLINQCVRRACNPNGIQYWEWRKAIGVACALYRHQTIQTENHLMSLEATRTTRDYLYGRLFAVADHLERRALSLAGENRDTNAKRLLQQFSEHPFKTWRTLEIAIEPYIKRLRSRQMGTLIRCQQEIDSIMGLFNPEDFTNDAKLSGEFLLAYHCQDRALWEKPLKEEKAEEQPSAI